MELATHVRDLLTAAGIPFWLDYGSLLGAVRDGRLIAWDVDIDFGILTRDAPAVIALARELQARGHQLDAGNPLSMKITYSRVNELHLDVNCWAERDALLMRDGVASCEWPGSAGTESFPPSYLESMTSVRLCGEPFPAPSPVEQFLADHRYGTGWRQPTRPVRVPGRAPAIGPEEMNEQVGGLVEALVEAEEAMDAVTADHRLGHTEGWRRWVDAGTPLRSDLSRVALLEAQHGAPGSDVARQLLATLAITVEGLDEVSHPTVSTAVRRNRRRLERLGRRAQRLIRGRLPRWPE